MVYIRFEFFILLRAFPSLNIFLVFFLVFLILCHREKLKMSIFLQQLLITPLLFQLTVFQHQNMVTILRVVNSVGDKEDGFSF